MHRRTASQRYLSQSGMPRPSGTPHFPSLVSLNPVTASNPSIFVTLFEFFHPRKSRQRTTILCLVSLVIVTTYVCFVSSPTLSLGHAAYSHHRMQLSHAEDAWRKLATKLPNPPADLLHQHRPEILLSPEQELGAVTAFMAALPQNVIPTDIDPTQPIDPQLVLDFDTRSPQAEEEVTNLVTDVWIRNPVVVFSKVRHPTFPLCFAIYGLFDLDLWLALFWQLPSAVSRELKSILQALNLKPAPTVFDVDQRGWCPLILPPTPTFQPLITCVISRRCRGPHPASLSANKFDRASYSPYRRYAGWVNGHSPRTLCQWTAKGACYPRRSRSRWFKEA
jgi:hypothetical protein